MLFSSDQIAGRWQLDKNDDGADKGRGRLTSERGAWDEKRVPGLSAESSQKPTATRRGSSVPDTLHPAPHPQSVSAAMGREILNVQVSGRRFCCAEQSLKSPFAGWSGQSSTMFHGVSACSRFANLGGKPGRRGVLEDAACRAWFRYVGGMNR